MSLSTAKQPAPKIPSAVWALGFRPFFLLGTSAGLLALFVWLLSLNGRLPALHFDMHWHAHEMIHGFFIAIIVGFLFTASQSWTQVRGIHGRQLQAIAAVWLAGRLAFLFPALHPLALAGVDLLFLPLAMGFLASYLLRQGQRHNLIFLIVLSLLWSSNVGYHLARQNLGIVSTGAWLYFAVHMIVVMVLVISSRILPFFTQKALTDYKKREHSRLDLATFAAAGAFAFAHLTLGSHAVMAALAGLSAGLTLLRFILWYDKRLWRHPVLWILYVAYLWLVTGFALSALAFLQMLQPSLAVHAFTAGAISTAVLGMISRVSLGHTGRPIKASSWVVGAYGLLLLGAILRVFAPMLLPTRYYELVFLSASLWIAAFLIFLVVFTPMLLSPRPDGQVG